MKKLSKILLVIMSAMMALSFAACGIKDPSLDGLKKYGKLVVATNAFFEPFEHYQGDKIVGWDIDFAQYFAEEIGVKLKVDDMDFGAVLTALETNKAHIAMAGITANEERRKSVDFTDSIFNSSQVVIVKNDSAVAKPADLLDKKVGGQVGTIGLKLGQYNFAQLDYASEAEMTEDLPGFGKPKSALSYKSGALAVLALKNGEIDAVIIDKYPAQKLVENNAGVKILDESVYDDEYAFAVKKGNKTLLDELNRLIAKSKTDGFYDKNTTKWFGGTDA